MGYLASVVLLVAGTLMLLSNLGILHLSRLGSVLHTWWPLLLIVVGLIGLLGRRK